MNISDGILSVLGATFVRDRHGSTTAQNDHTIGVGLYQVVYTLLDIDGTYTASSEVYLSPDAELTVMIHFNH